MTKSNQTKISKFRDGHFEDDRSGIYTWILVYDKNGNYLGQWQTNVSDEGDIWLEAEEGGCVNGRPVDPLSPEQMAVAGQVGI